MLVKRFNHTSGVAAVTPTARPKSVGIYCLIEVFGDVFALLFWIFLWVYMLLSQDCVRSLPFSFKLALCELSMILNHL